MLIVAEIEDVLEAITSTVPQNLHNESRILREDVKIHYIFRETCPQEPLPAYERELKLKCSRAKRYDIRSEVENQNFT